MFKYLIIIALAFSLLGNVWLVKKLFRSHHINTELRLNPAQLSNKTAAYALNTDVLIFGDSLAALWFPEPNDKDVLNLGIQGQTTAQLLLRADHELAEITSEWSVLLAGGNDLKAVASFPDRADAIVEQAIENVKQLLVMMPGSKKVVATTPPIFSLPLRYRLLDYRAAIRAQQKFNERIRQLANSQVKVLDLYQMFENEDQLKRFSNDGVHPNQLAYERVNAELLLLMKE